MKYRKLGRTEIPVSEVGYGMWGLASWKGHDSEEVLKALDFAIELGCNFFDTAWAYGAGMSESVLGQLIKKHGKEKIVVASKIPPMNLKWPAQKNFTLEEVFPDNHVINYVEKSLANLQLECIDLMQFHVWNDDWAKNESWQACIEKLKKEGKVKHFGISINRWEPTNCIQSLQTGCIDAVQVVYNIFDQNPEDELFPYCKENNIGIIARVPFDEGSLAGQITSASIFEPDDFRYNYFSAANLIATLPRVEKIKSLVPEHLSLAEMALRFILDNPSISTVIPGMRSRRNVEKNMLVSSSSPLDNKLFQQLKSQRWERKPGIVNA